MEEMTSISKYWGHVSFPITAPPAKTFSSSHCNLISHSFTHLAKKEAKELCSQKTQKTSGRSREGEKSRAGSAWTFSRLACLESGPLSLRPSTENDFKVGPTTGAGESHLEPTQKPVSLHTSISLFFVQSKKSNTTARTQAAPSEWPHPPQQREVGVGVT